MVGEGWEVGWGLGGEGGEGWEVAEPVEDVVHG